VTTLPGHSTRSAGRRLRVWVVAGLSLAAAAGGWTYHLSAQGRDAAAMAMAPAGTDAVQRALALGKPTVVEFGSTSCAGCREMKPLLAQLAREHGDRVAVADVDVLKEREYLGRYRIMVMPTQVFFDAQGRETSRHVGTISVPDMLQRLVPAGPQGPR
jgi:thioredoxin 1